MIIVINNNSVSNILKSFPLLFPDDTSSGDSLRCVFLHLHSQDIISFSFVQIRVVIFLLPTLPYSNQRCLSPSSSLLSDKLHATGKLLDDLHEVQSARLSHRPEGPTGPTPEVVIRPSPQEKVIGKRLDNLSTKF